MFNLDLLEEIDHRLTDLEGGAPAPAQPRRLAPKAAEKPTDPAAICPHLRRLADG